MSVYLIDGYNLLHEVVSGRGSAARGAARSRGKRRGRGEASSPEGDRFGEAESGPKPLIATDLEDERRRLLDRIASFMGGTSDRAIIVFDSHGEMLQKSKSATNQVDVYFGSFSKSADSIIEREVYALSPGESVIVVTSDWQLQRTIFLPNVIRRSSRQFAAELQADTKRIANRSDCITMNHRIEERIPAETLERLARLRDELKQERPGEEGSHRSG